ncbi:MAG: tetratricopeptide (TPR) repeat protein [Chlamydiales bacterium]
MPDDWDAFEERWTTFILAIELEPASADDHVILATDLRREGEYVEAIKHYELASGLAPDTPKVSYWTGYCFKRQGKYEDAIPHLEAAAEADEDDPAPMYQLARIIGRMDREKEDGDPERALEYAVEASDRVHDKDPHYLSFVARGQHLGGDVRSAKKTMKRVLKLVKKADEGVQNRYRKMLDEM